MSTVTIRETTWQVSVATTQAELAQGLSGLQYLEAYHAMLFDMGYPHQSIAINMQGMLFPLDVVFIKEDLTVTSVVLNVQPGEDFTEEFTEGARYFLEMNAGELPIEVTEGDVITFYDYYPPEEDLSMFIEQVIMAGGLMIVVVIMVGALR